MDGKVAPEYIYDQGLYYPAAGNYYVYLPTGMEAPREWDNCHRFTGLGGQDAQFSQGLQSENLPCIYYTPSYDYPESPYNPFNPYIPGAVGGADSSFVASQQCFTSPPYLQSVSPPSYIPVVTQSGPDTLLNGYPDQFLLNGGVAQYAPSLSAMGVANTSLEGSLENLSLEPSWSFSHPAQVTARLAEGTLVNSVPPKQLLSYGAVTNASAPQTIQKMDNYLNVGIPAVHSIKKVTLPTNNGSTKLRSDVPEWVPVNRMKPKPQYSGFPNRSVGEQNMGPRSHKPRVQLAPPVALKLDDNVTVYEDQYNRDDFPVDYPEAKFFVIKSYSEDDVHKSIKYNVWSSTSNGNKKLDIAYQEAQRISFGKSRKCPVFLFFSVNASGHFCGVAEMIGPVDFHKDMDFWLQDKWTGSFPVRWHIVKDIPNSSFRHIILVNNEYRPVTSSRDTQEVQYLPGINMLTIFKNTPLKTSILDAFMFYENRQRKMQEENSIIGLKSYDTSGSLPAVITSDKTVHAVNQPTLASGLEADIKADNLEPNERTPVDHTVNEDEKAESRSNDTVTQPVKANADIANDVCLPLEKLNRSPGTARTQAKYKRVIKGSGRLDGNVAVDSQGEKDVSPVPDICSLSINGKVGEVDILNVGSMQINITDTNSCFSGPLTVGSIPVDKKG